MNSVLVLGASSGYGKAIAQDLMSDFEVFGLSRSMPQMLDIEHWLDCDLEEPQQVLLAMQQLHAKEAKLSAAVSAVGGRANVGWDQMTYYDLLYAGAKRVFSPLMLVKYLLDFGVLKWDGVVVFLDCRIGEGLTQAVGGTIMRPVVEEMSKHWPSSLRRAYVTPASRDKMGAEKDLNEQVRRILNEESTNENMVSDGGE